jgi:nucleoside phosphorylase
VAFLGFRPAFWGDISGEVVHYLASHCGVREILYLGKLGSVRKGIKPNTVLATGGLSYVRGQAVEWENVLEDSVASVAQACTITGNHITLGSVLHETKNWLASLPGSVDFVDPEVGMMGQAAVQHGIRFGYLHIISDNVAEKYEEDLSNERMRNVLRGRSKLYEVVQDILGHHLSSAVERDR